MGAPTVEMLPAPKALPRPNRAATHNLHHVPPTLITFTVEYLSKLFSAVIKPHDMLKRPDRPIDDRKYPEFRHFIRTLLINGRISADTLVHALIYLSRFHRRVSRKRALIEEGAKHKLFLAALLVASKFCDDRHPLATIIVCDFLPVGLLSLAEVNRIERAFLCAIQYKLVVDPDELALLLSKHGIDIRSIARDIQERLTPPARGPASVPIRAVAVGGGARQPTELISSVLTAANRSAAQMVFSGIQPTGVPQLGNYLGSIRNWVRLQTQELEPGKPHEQFISVVNLHAITVPRDPGRLRLETVEMAASLIACGIDPARSVLFQSKRIMSLRDPTKKMSKSDPNEQSRITLSDSDAQIKAKVQRAPTDSIAGISFDPDTRPGVSNLVSIYAALNDIGPHAAAHDLRALNNAQLKSAVTDTVISAVAPIRDETRRLLQDQAHVEAVLRAGEETARAVSAENWARIARCIGLD
ncbi:Tryptophan--tRNA ligase, mitochondrial [Coemansia biformis]|uniref:tryptophan--tRNA ligase n=1 Tax=Coemansia biformis TaxID=1286918 RepID=A0A9W8CYZ1_9FUNG|nr:Tryptophan--tRNA ligase, mitochondrial [Coemansia biformis]